VSFLRIQRAPGEHQVASAHRPDQTRQHLAVVRVGDAAQQFGHPERRPVTHHGHVAAQGYLQTAALTQPVDRRHHRLHGLAQRLERRHVHPQR
jgi:hypothetical protein